MTIRIHVNESRGVQVYMRGEIQTNKGNQRKLKGESNLVGPLLSKKIKENQRKFKNFKEHQRKPMKIKENKKQLNKIKES